MPSINHPVEFDKNMESNKVTEMTGNLASMDPVKVAEMMEIVAAEFMGRVRVQVRKWQHQEKENEQQHDVKRIKSQQEN